MVSQPSAIITRPETVMEAIWGISPQNAQVPSQTTYSENEDTHLYFYQEVFGRGNGFLSYLDNVDRRLQAEQRSEPIWIHIYSYGGDLFTAMNIVDHIQNVESPVYAVVEGIAASAATLIACACDKVYMRPNAQFMVHQLSSIMWGTHQQFDDEMRLQKDLMGKMVDIYASRARIPRADIEDMLKRDYWMNANEAVAKGFADGLYGEVNVATPNIQERMYIVGKKTTAEETIEEEVVLEEEVVEEEAPVVADEEQVEAKKRPAPVTEAAKRAAQALDNEQSPVTTDVERLNARINALESSMKNLAEIINQRFDELDAPVSDMADAMPTFFDAIVKAVKGAVSDTVEKSQMEREAEEELAIVAPAPKKQATRRPAKAGQFMPGTPGVN